MAAQATAARNPLAAEEARLACAAAAGDGAAFATLYERYERRAHNLAYRLCGSEDDAAEAVQEAFVGLIARLPKLGDRSLDFRAYLFAATRNACFDLIRKRTRTRPSDSIPESATPLGSGAGGLGLDPGAPEEDPGRSQLLAAQQEEIREANGRLPERQREVLALRELEELSYEEIAAIMEMNRNSVAQLISRARVKLRDELRGSALNSIVARSPDCERALALIAMRDDGQLDPDSEDAAWLDRHLEECDRCRIGREAMQEAGVSYRAWVPIAVAPWLLKETMAMAAERIGADWSAAIAAARGSRPAPSTVPGMPSRYRGGRGSPRPRAPGGAAVVAGVAALTIVVAGVVAAPVSKNADSTPAAQPLVGAKSSGPSAGKPGSTSSGRTPRSTGNTGGTPPAFASLVSTPLTEAAAPGGAAGPEAPSGGGAPPGLGPTLTTGGVPAPESEPEPAPVAGSPPGSQPLEETMSPDSPPRGGAPEAEEPEAEEPGEEEPGEEEPGEEEPGEEEPGEEEPGEEEPEGEDPREEPPDCEKLKQCGELPER